MVADLGGPQGEAFLGGLREACLVLPDGYARVRGPIAVVSSETAQGSSHSGSAASSPGPAASSCSAPAAESLGSP
eukprot:10645423-Lingulodinium_polyedra.AAC.1